MAMTFDHVTPGQRVLFGSGAAVDNAVTAIESLEARRVLVIAGSSMRSFADSVATRIPVVHTIDEVVQHVPAENAAAAVASARAQQVDAVLAAGGGSATGLAKIVARETGVPIVSVPSTFSGSEATNVWGLTEAGRKVTGTDPQVLPQVVVYDASLLMGMPTQLAVSSGINAIAHSVDGFWAPRADPINAALGAESLRALVPGLRALSNDPDDIAGWETALAGAYLAGIAFASAGGGMHHKICHALGGTFGMPHAETHSVVIPYVAAFNAAAASDASERISDALGGAAPGAGLQRLGADLGAHRSLAELGFQESDIPEAASIILPAIPASNPRPVGQHDLETLLRAAWAGEPAA